MKWAVFKLLKLNVVFELRNIIRTYYSERTILIENTSKKDSYSEKFAENQIDWDTTHRQNMD
jgi:hypothetical protein